MASRIPASERTSQKLDELLSQGVADGAARAELLKLAVRTIVEEALEAEVAEAVGRDYCENGRGARRRVSQRLPPRAPAHGGRLARVRRAPGQRSRRAVRLARARRPGRPHGRARAPGRGDVRPWAEHARHRGRAPGRHGRDLLSRTAVTQVTERLWQEYEAFAARDLSEFAVAYLFIDGVAERLHAGLPREAVLCAWAITEDGRNVLLHLAPATKEDTASCTAFFGDLKRRGLADPLLVVTDGAPGLIRAVETCFPRALRQRCLAHRLAICGKASEEGRGSGWPTSRASATASLSR